MALSKSLIRSRFFSIMCWISKSASDKLTLASFVSSCWLLSWASYNNFFSVKFFTRISNISIKKSCSFFLRSWFTIFSSTLFAVVFVTLISLWTCKLYVSTYFNIEFSWFKSSLDCNTIFSCSLTLWNLSLYILTSSWSLSLSCFCCSSKALHFEYCSLKFDSTFANCCCKEYKEIPISSLSLFNFLESSVFSLNKSLNFSSSAFNCSSNEFWNRRRWGWSAGKCSNNSSSSSAFSPCSPWGLFGWFWFGSWGLFSILSWLGFSLFSSGFIF